MDILLDIGVNLVAGLIGFFIGWIWQGLRKTFKLRKARKFWKPIAKNEMRIVVGRHHKFKSFEPSGFLGVGSAIGLAELNTQLESLGLRNFSTTYPDRLNGDDLKSNLILIGGPDANAITNEAITRIKTTLKFGNPETHEIAIYDSQTQTTYAPTIKKNSDELVKDYGVILKTSNPFAPKKQLLLIAGSFGYGVWAGVRYLKSKEFVADPIVSSGKSFECLVEVDMVLDTPQNIKPIVLRELE